MKVLAKIFAFFMLAASVALAVTVFLDDHAMARRHYIDFDDTDEA